MFFECPRLKGFQGLDTRVDCGDSKPSDLIDSASSCSRDQPKGQYNSSDGALQDRFRLEACDISINGVFLVFEGPTKNKHLRFLTRSVGFFEAVKAQYNALGCNCSPLD